MRSSAQAFVERILREDIHMQPFHFTQTLVDNFFAARFPLAIAAFFLKLVVDVRRNVANGVVER